MTLHAQLLPQRLGNHLRHKNGETLDKTRIVALAPPAALTNRCYLVGLKIPSGQDHGKS